MTAFVAFIRTYALWLYLLCALGILFGIKMFLDARRLARTTLFSLEQERAGEQSARALVLIAVLLVAMGTVSTIHALLGPVVPMPESPIVRGPTATLLVVFPSSTPVPTPTPTRLKPTETVFVTNTPVVATATRAAAKPISPPVLPATPTPPLPAPTIIGPLPNGGAWTGEGQMHNNIVFRWKWDCDQCVLGPNDRFAIVISYISKAGKPTTIGGGTQNAFLSLGDIVRGAGVEVYHQAYEDKYQWYVQVKRGEQPLTPPSATWTFIWH